MVAWTWKCALKMCISGNTVHKNVNTHCQNCTSVAFIECWTARIAHTWYLCNFAGNEGEVKLSFAKSPG
jgi:hypothetical protein